MDHKNESVINVETYLKQLPNLDKKLEGNIFYRGQSNSTYTLTPSVFRKKIRIEENKIYTEIMTECAHEFEGCSLHNEILSKMQHYGVPTRLLDVTTNALVALYFACDDNKDVDGVVYVIKTDESRIKQYDSDAISILASLPRFKDEEKKEMLALAKEVRANGFGDYDYDDIIIADFNKHKIIKRLLHEIKKEKPAFENIINPNDILTNYFLIPRKNNARIIRQSGAFIIFGLIEEEIKEENDSLKFRHLNYINSIRIIIDKYSKETIINQLSCFGISKATLHPELYKVAEFIKEKYLIT
jgi:hypothetical protein